MTMPSLTAMLARTAAAAALVCLGAGAAAECRGRDVFEALRREDPSGYRALQEKAASLPFRRGRLFRISRDGLAPSYLFGTLHLADPRVTALSDTVREALESASVVVVESTEVTSPGSAGGKDAKADRQDALLARPSQRADRLLDRDAFAAFEALVAERGLPQTAARRFKPTVLALLLDQPPCARPAAKDRPYLDALIAESATRAGTRLVGLETLAEQLNALDGLPPEAERDLLVSVLQQSRAGPDVIETQVLRYRESDPGALLAWLDAARPIPGIEDAQTPPAFLERLLTRRTRRMRERVLPLLLHGGAFVAVGVVHLPGPDGLASLVQEAGFTVERLE